MSKFRGYAVAVDSTAEHRFQEVVRLNREAGRPVRTIGDVLREANGDTFLTLAVHPALQREAATLFRKTGDPAWKAASQAHSVVVSLEGLQAYDPSTPVVVGYELDTTPSEARLLHGHS